MFGLKSTLITGAVGAAACAALWLLWSLDVAQLELDHKNALAAQKQSLTEQCEKDKAITKEVSDELQTQLDDVRSQLARAKRMQPNRCVPVLADPAKRDDATANDAQLHHTDGVYSDALLDFAYDAEVVGRQLDACQSFVTKVWSRK